MVADGELRRAVADNDDAVEEALLRRQPRACATPERLIAVLDALATKKVADRQPASVEKCP